MNISQCPQMCMCACPGHGLLPLEGSDQREVSREISPMYTPERERLVKKKNICEVCECNPAYMNVCVCVGRSPVSRSVSTLQDIPEVLDELLERVPAESPG